MFQILLQIRSYLTVPEVMRTGHYFYLNKPISWKTISTLLLFLRFQYLDPRWPVCPPVPAPAGSRNYRDDDAAPFFGSEFEPAGDWLLHPAGWCGGIGGAGGDQLWVEVERR